MFKIAQLQYYSTHEQFKWISMLLKSSFNVNFLGISLYNNKYSEYDHNAYCIH